jgi:hypothetical protein
VQDAARTHAHTVVQRHVGVKVRVRVDPAKPPDHDVMSDDHPVTDRRARAHHAHAAPMVTPSPIDTPGSSTAVGCTPGRACLRVEQWQKNGEGAVHVADDNARHAIADPAGQLLRDEDGASRRRVSLAGVARRGQQCESVGAA